MNPDYRDEPRDHGYMDYHHQASAPPLTDDVTRLSPTADHNQSLGDTTKTPEGDNSVTLERQPIYAQVTKKSSPDPQDVKDPKAEEIADRYEYKVYIPRHRSRCVSCGCPRVCCLRNFVFLWVVIFILLQGGPLAVLIIDLIGIKSEGATIHRYVAEWGMKPAVCGVSGYFISDFKSCGCLLSNSRKCDGLIKGYGCIEVMVDVHTYHESEAIAKSVFMWKSEREYVLDTMTPHCFNLDICTIDKSIPWYEYRNNTKQDEKILQEKKRDGEGIVCYYKENGKRDPIVVMQLNTSFWQVLLWFILPMAGLLLCWIMFFTCLCWYCCPKQRTRMLKKDKSADNMEPDEGESRYLMPYND